MRIQSYDGEGAEISETANVTGPPLLESVGAKTTDRATAGVATGNLVLAVFSDTDAGTPPTGLSSKILWGDGSTSQGTVIAVPGGYEVVGTHTYARAGTFRPMVRLAESGASAQATSTSIVVARGSRGKSRAARQ